ncbi:MAG: Hpt domain-containing protein [Thermoanaerobaculia bacterium]|nr:Hpt domain-containing protein [Thermoanaerobaculia bacterium]
MTASRKVSAFDQDAALSRLGGDFELFDELIEMFCESADDQIGEIETSIREGDADQLRQTAHALSGSLALFAAGPALETARRLEHMGRDGELLDTDLHLGRLNGELAELLEQLRIDRESRQQAA